MADRKDKTEYSCFVWNFVFVRKLDENTFLSRAIDFLHSYTMTFSLKMCEVKKN